ncbi:hypothetical protein ACT4ZY_06740 [Acinetobacter baumannii]
MKKYIISLLLTFSGIVHAEDSYAFGYEIDNFDKLTEFLFDSDRSNWVSLYRTESDAESKAMDGAKYLYCASIADYLALIDDAPKFYDIGMQLLDDYATEHAKRDTEFNESIENHSSIYNGIYYKQSWLINDKNVLKGIIFNTIYEVVDKEFYKDNLIGNKDKKVNFKNIYSNKCKPLSH